MHSPRLLRPDSKDPTITVSGIPREPTTYPSDPTDSDDLDGRSVRRGHEVREDFVGFHHEDPAGWIGGGAAAVYSSVPKPSVYNSSRPTSCGPVHSTDRLVKTADAIAAYSGAEISSEAPASVCCRLRASNAWYWASASRASLRIPNRWNA